MPNWCENIATISHDNKESMQPLVNALKSVTQARKEYYDKLDNESVMDTFQDCYEANYDDCPQFFQATHPMPDELKGTSSPQDSPNWHDWRLANWGTKWDVRYDSLKIHSMSDTSITVQFDTAWSPPQEWYAHMRLWNFKVDAYYFEGAMDFCGLDTEEDGEETYSCSQQLDLIPSRIDKLFGISEYYKEMEEIQEDE